MDSYKEAIQAKLNAKKNQAQLEKKDKSSAFNAIGEKRVGVKKFKKGGLFDK